MNYKDYFFYGILMVILAGGAIGMRYNSYKHSEFTPEKATAPSNAELPWSDIDTIDLELNMEKMDVVMVKRSFNDGDEVTLIEKANGEKHYLSCSREIHKRLVEQFRELRLKKESGF